jgi:membrane-bound inhibitor of C-type lysozyme
MQDHDPAISLEPLPGGAVRRWLSNKRSRWTAIAAAGALACVVIGLSLSLMRSPSVPAGIVASNARSGPAAGGAAGTVSALSASSFTITTAAGQQVTVNEASSTTYQNGTSSASADAVTPGETVLVLGTTNGTTITATQVIVQPTGDYGSAASSAAGVVPFQQGASSASKQVGQIPTNYSQGSGTIVSGAAADEATKAALAAYPGGVVDRVVQLSDGEYEVHDIGVNWPHHIFVNQDFMVVGAN